MLQELLERTGPVVTVEDLYRLMGVISTMAERIMPALPIPEGYELVLSRRELTQLPHLRLGLELRDVVRRKSDGTLFARAMYPENHPHFDGHFDEVSVLKASSVLEGAEQAGALFWLLSLGGKEDVKVRALGLVIEEIRNLELGIRPYDVLWFSSEQVFELSPDKKSGTFARRVFGRLQGVVSVRVNDPESEPVTRCTMGGYFTWAAPPKEPEVAGEPS